jgi:hypothetical protein
MPEIEPDTLIFQVDFNNMDPDGRVRGSFAHASSSRVPGVGERVVLVDEESNACWAVVLHVGQRILRFEMERATWTSGEDISATGIPALAEPRLAWNPEPVAV